VTIQADTSAGGPAEVAQLRAEMEHLKDALAGQNDGVRLWMLDCGELAAKHRARASAAEAMLAVVRELAENWRRVGPDFRAAEAGTYILETIQEADHD
jgi:hypothetical protein